MKKVVSLILAVLMLAALCVSFASCGGSNQKYTIGICQLVTHDALDAATQGFKDAVEKGLGKDNVEFIFQNAANDSNTCTTIVASFVSKDVDLIMANATPALLAAANATTTIPVLGTSVTDYNDTFAGNIPANVTGTSDAVPFAEQAKMMIESLNLAEGDKVKVTLRFRGREMAHAENGNVIMDRFAEACAEVGTVEKPAKLEGRSMLMFLVPKTTK